MTVIGKDGRIIAPDELARMVRLEELADRLFLVALDLPIAPPTRDGLGPLVVELRFLVTELEQLRADTGATMTREA